MKFIKTIHEGTGEYDGSLVNIDLIECASPSSDGQMILQSLSGDTFAVKERDFNSATDDCDKVKGYQIKKLIESIERLSVRIPSSIRMHM